MAYLYSLGFLSVLWECGGTLAARAIAEGAVQKSLPLLPQNYWRQYPPTPVGDLGFTTMTEALSLERVLANCGFRLLSRRLFIEQLKQIEPRSSP